MPSIARLLCGAATTDGIAKTALDQLGRSINFFGSRAIIYLKGHNSPDLISFGPFCSRVLLENSCAALVGRLDTFRMMYLSEFQAQPEYETGKRAKSSFAWSGDVLPSDEKPLQNLWSIEHDLPKIGRALLSRHFDHMYWKPAVDRMLDYVSGIPNNPLLTEVLALDAENYINSTKGRSAQLHSMLSKGVHWEFFSTALLFDDITVKNAIRDTVMLIGHLGLISHFIPTSYAALPAEEAIENYLFLRGEIE